MPRYLPTVASFVPNMPLGSPLKISIHSWEAPIASPEARALAQQTDWIQFEARLLLDGVGVAYVGHLSTTEYHRLITISGGSSSVSKLAGLRSLVSLFGMPCSKAPLTDVVESRHLLYQGWYISTIDIPGLPSGATDSKLLERW